MSVAPAVLVHMAGALLLAAYAATYAAGGSAAAAGGSSVFSVADDSFHDEQNHVLLKVRKLTRECLHTVALWLGHNGWHVQSVHRHRPQQLRPGMRPMLRPEPLALHC